MTKKSGFTLAEVLITLGIIGVVAAMTIPTLIANTNSAKFKSQYKKVVSTLNQAGLMGQAQYDMDFAAASDACTATTDDPQQTSSICAILNGTLAGYSVSDTKPTGYSPTFVTGAFGETLSNLYFYTLADGALVAVPTASKGDGCTVANGTIASSGLQAAAGSASAGDLNKCVGFIDVNGAAAPNKEVTCTSSTALGGAVGDCIVPNDAAHTTDIYPILFHDASVQPATNAAAYVLTASK